MDREKHSLSASDQIGDCDYVSAEEAKLHEHYDQIALSGNDSVTALDYNLRALEIDFALQHICDGTTVLDVGCGMGVALREYASRRHLFRACGIDYSANMIQMAKQKTSAAGLQIEFEVASAATLPYPDGSFDVVTSHRCLLALLTWERQQEALHEFCRVLRPGGSMLLMEATTDGLARLNSYRRRFNLPEIGESGRDGYERLLLNESSLFRFLVPMFEIMRVQRFGMYYFLTRILQPLFVAPEMPRYDHKLNDVAREICRIVPDFEGIGHLVGFAFRKRG